MSGCFRGCQAEIKKHQPLALFSTCGAHNIQLVVSKAIESAEFMQDALSRSQDVVELFTQSGRFKSIYFSTNDDVNTAAPGSLRPICPTRWLTRSPSINSVLDNFEHIMVSLLECSKKLGYGNTLSKRANNAYANLAHWKCILGLLAAKPIIEKLELLNKSLQAKTLSFNGMKRNVSSVRNELCSLRTEQTFKEVFDACVNMCDDLGLQRPGLPRRRKVPKRFETGEPASFQNSAEDLYRAQFFGAIDVALSNLDRKFDSADFQKLETLSNTLINGVADRDFFQSYPEFNLPQLQMQLDMYVSNYKRPTVAEHVQVFKEMSPDTESLFPEVKKLLKLVLISPTSSCEAERSFSSMRRLKTWLRANQTQKRLNHVVVCNVHKLLISELSEEDIVKEFVKEHSLRSHVFGC